MRTQHESYRPTADEPYMNPEQMEYFRLRLMAWRQQVQKEYEESRTRLKEEKEAGADLMDRGASETELQMDITIRERTRNLLLKIDAALRRIEEGTYGYCEETGEEIGLKRLEAQPLATLSFEAQRDAEQFVRMRRNLVH
jgi:DnaK suppressor protein